MAQDRKLYTATFICRACGGWTELTSVKPITDKIDPHCEMLERHGDVAGLARRKEIAAEGMRNRKAKGLPTLHTAEPVFTGTAWRAECAVCKWEGETHGTRAQATDDAIIHNETLNGASAD
jgi:hypothetical protein